MYIYKYAYTYLSNMLFGGRYPAARRDSVVPIYKYIYIYIYSHINTYISIYTHKFVYISCIYHIHMYQIKI
jgi:hypothetical protein